MSQGDDVARKLLLSFLETEISLLDLVLVLLEGPGDRSRTRRLIGERVLELRRDHDRLLREEVRRAS